MYYKMITFYQIKPGYLLKQTFQKLNREQKLVFDSIKKLNYRAFTEMSLVVCR